MNSRRSGVTPLAATFKRRGTLLPKRPPLAFTDTFTKRPETVALWKGFVSRERANATPSDAQDAPIFARRLLAFSSTSTSNRACILTWRRWCRRFWTETIVGKAKEAASKKGVADAKKKALRAQRCRAGRVGKKSGGGSETAARRGEVVKAAKSSKIASMNTGDNAGGRAGKYRKPAASGMEKDRWFFRGVPNCRSARRRCPAKATGCRESASPL